MVFFKLDYQYQQNDERCIAFRDRGLPFVILDNFQTMANNRKFAKANPMLTAENTFLTFQRNFATGTSWCKSSLVS